MKLSNPSRNWRCKERQATGGEAVVLNIWINDERVYWAWMFSFDFFDFFLFFFFIFAIFSLLLP